VVVISGVFFKGVPSEYSWTSYWKSVWFCGTVFTTIGYGNISPQTDAGKALMIVYAIGMLFRTYVGIYNTYRRRSEPLQFLSHWSY
ncbi:MAG: two pore domain potassium channel family protein, partial [Desulfobacteraceae bacterium]|nr:two pore domain potassium channel family protein [Desulfobacteraceae bacterium]